ncbi:MAG: hypothetical protein EZS28_029489 [Streblomastix strix]|uniref:C2H2-type domain-containing protein n=1 Tax=Streblomastix strix TaxID=222440 RepID=A0A5J4UYZ6_9EUKA|nr:MAG: hypothetical protein EZS28_029489 [Streblomastix strix]
MELIQCEICNKKIPFSSYQKHVDDHLATATKAKNQKQAQIKQTGSGGGSVVFTPNAAFKGQKPTQDKKGSDNEAQIPCEVCQHLIRHSQYEQHINQHMQQIAAAKPKAKLLQQQKLVGNMIICDICNQQMLSKNLVKHLLKHDRKTPVECQHCGQVIQLKHYKTHTLFHELEIRQSRGQPMECEVCGEDISTNQYYQHIKSENKGDEYVNYCRECDKEINQKQYSQHLYAHKLVDQMKMIQMGQQSKTQTSKPKNIGVFRKIANAFSTNAERKTQCKFCRDMPIMKIKDLDQHYEERHKENPVEPCEKCKKAYLFSELIFHRQKHGLFK